jgi:hypothetical protein
MRSPEYFAENYCWIQQKASAGVVDKTSIIPFAMGSRAPSKHEVDERNVPEQAQFYFQRQILRWLHKRQDVLTLKSRRVGCSWVAAIYVAWLINFHENVSVAFISRTGRDAKDVLAKVKFILRNLALHDHDNIRKATKADWLCGHIYTSNQEILEIGWRNDSGVVTVTSSVVSLNNTDDSGRSGDYSFIVFDELDFYEHPDITWASATTTLARGGHWMAISTPNMLGQVFHRMCAQADLWEAGKSTEPPQLKYIKVHWSEAGITEAQVKKSTIGFTQELADKEWEWKWITPGTVAFDPTHLAVCYKPPEHYPEIALELENYRLKVNEADGKYYYYSGADTSKGNPNKKSRLKDYHAFVAVTKSGIQAGEYYSQEQLSKWAGHVVDNGGEKIVVKGTLSKLHAEYPGYLQIEEEGPGYTAVNNHEIPDDTFSHVAAVSMKHKFKKGAVERLIIKVENHQFIITSLALYQQMSTFQKGSQPGQYEAAAGYYDDLVVAAILAEDARDQEGGMEFSFGISAGDAQRAIEGYGQRMERLPAGPQVQLTIPGINRRQSEGIFGELPPLPDLPNDDGWLRSLVEDPVTERDY